MHNGSEWVTVQNETRVVLGLPWPAVLVSDTKPLRIQQKVWKSCQIEDQEEESREKGGKCLSEERESAPIEIAPPLPPTKPATPTPTKPATPTLSLHPD